MPVSVPEYVLAEELVLVNVCCGELMLVNGCRLYHSVAQYNETSDLV
jgi:hypothetical protein